MFDNGKFGYDYRSIADWVEQAVACVHKGFEMLLPIADKDFDIAQNLPFDDAPRVPALEQLDDYIERCTRTQQYVKREALRHLPRADKQRTDICKAEQRKPESANSKREYVRKSNQLYKLLNVFRAECDVYSEGYQEYRGEYVCNDTMRNEHDEQHIQQSHHKCGGTEPYRAQFLAHELPRAPEDEQIHEEIDSKHYVRVYLQAATPYCDKPETYISYVCCEP